MGRSRASLVGVLFGVVCLACAGERAADLPSVDAGPAGAFRGGVLVLGAAATPWGDARRAERLAELLGGGGIRGARARCEDASWKVMQPDVGGPIEFARLDAFVAAHQSRGMSELLVCLGTSTRVGTRRGELGSRGALPLAEELDAFASWVAAVVERYDADGVDDMPALELPVRFYEVGLEFASQTSPSIDGYLLLLARAHEAAHSAHPEVVVAHAAWLLATAPDLPAPARLGLLSEADRARVLEHPESFDAVNLQVLVDAASLDVELAELRAEMARHGYHKPVILSHVAPSPLVGWGPATRCEPAVGNLGLLIRPAREGDRCPLAAHFRRLVAADPGALAWTWRFAAAELVRKSVVAASHDVVALFAGPVEDTAWWQESAFEAAAGVMAWSGLVDVRTRSRRPAHSALEQLASVFDGRDQVVRVDMGDSAVRLYAVTGPPGTVWVGWHEPWPLSLPGQPPRAIEIQFDLGEAELALTPMASLVQEPVSRSAEIDADRRARIVLTDEPIYLRPASSRRGARKQRGAKP